MLGEIMESSPRSKEAKKEGENMERQKEPQSHSNSEDRITILQKKKKSNFHEYLFQYFDFYINDPSGDTVELGKTEGREIYNPTRNKWASVVNDHFNSVSIANISHPYPSPKWKSPVGGGHVRI